MLIFTVKLKFKGGVLDEDTKKIKIQELKTQLRELEKAKMLETSLSSINNENNVKKKENIKTNIHGDTLEIGMDIIKAGVSLDNLRNLSATKAGLQGKSNLLTSEIKIDKGRGLNTERKEEELSKIKDGINRTNEFLSQGIKDTNENIKASTDSSEVESDNELTNESLQNLTNE